MFDSARQQITESCSEVISTAASKQGYSRRGSADFICQYDLPHPIQWIRWKTATEDHWRSPFGFIPQELDLAAGL
ncbi:uncharacterized protein A1O9_06713 [Exophiala aquamarina CBS 119918]|uniref:Uncharacterized protein n=1 Tax=Exophiala aquamarina CBS 119918 TaxID=1182545 RepID=A0A072P9H8_9EURO|nr:uncharacterized protein A1O9_06713 [Exophiala aquamarina CBS 119918]KEF56526.1 hypothetical protein A1O9_06713 [Exophiala aquamarina CBS 119918]